MANKITVYVGDQLYSSGENDADGISFSSMRSDQNSNEPQSNSSPLDTDQFASDISIDNNERRRLGDIDTWGLHGKHNKFSIYLRKKISNETK